MRKIANAVYFESSYFSGNVGFVSTTDGAVLVDTPMLPKDAWDWLKKITSVTKQGIAALINTDYQVERILGNCFFPTTVTIAHQAAWTELQRYDEAYLQRHISHLRQHGPELDSALTKVRIVLPELTLTGDMTLYKGDHVFDMVYVGGHTPASILVRVPKSRVLFAGSVVVTGEHPSMSQGNSERWLQALELIRAMDDVDTVVPGHGQPCSPAETQVLSDYIQAMRDRVYEHYSSGCTRRETVDKVRMLDFFTIPSARRQEIERRIRSSVERVYDEFKKGAERKRR